MAHWDEERDARWVAMMRKCATSPRLKELADKFEATGDIIYWDAFILELRKGTASAPKDIQTPQR